VDELVQCSKCKEWKARSSFLPRKEKKNGLTSICKDCRSAYSKVYTATHKEELNAKGRVYYAENQEALREKRREYYWEHRDEQRAYGRAYTAENLDKERQRWRDYYHRNREERNELAKAYHKTERGASSVKAAYHRRKARKRSLLDIFTIEDEQATRAAFGGGCAICGRQPGLWHTIALDHWIPLDSSDCPGTVPWNMVPMCHGDGGCNNSKKNRNAGEWLTERYGNKKARAIQAKVEAYLVSRQPDRPTRPDTVTEAERGWISLRR
jgi:hypothetical protein